MWNFHLTDLAQLLGDTWLVLLIGFGAAGLAFAVGWTSLRRRKTPPPSARADAAPAPDIDPFTTGGSYERRAAARRAGHAVTVALTHPDEPEPALHGWVANRSLGGLCLMVPQAVPINSVWKARPSEAPRTTPPVRVIVKTCVAEGGAWKLNCQFEKTPSYAVLLMFG